MKNEKRMEKWIRNMEKRNSIHSRRQKQKDLENESKKNMRICNAIKIASEKIQEDRNLAKIFFLNEKGEVIERSVWFVNIAEKYKVLVSI